MMMTTPPAEGWKFERGAKAAARGGAQRLRSLKATSMQKHRREQLQLEYGRADIGRREA